MSRIELGTSETAVGAEEWNEMIDLGSSGDSVLVVAIGRWHEDALAEVYRRHGGAVHSLARRVVGSDALADEVTQDVFVDLWKRPERFDPARGALRTFLLTSAHGKAVDIVRSEASRRAREEKSSRETVEAGYDIDRYAWDLAVADRVKIAVESLPGGERKAIELAYFDGRTYREVAEILGEPEGTVKSRIRSGLRRLKGLLTAQGVETSWAES
jgi:RNA polymerase sigma-70 factor, ECF subfamily